VRGLADQLVELGDRLADLGAKLLVAAVAGLALLERLLDPLQGALGAVEGSGKGRVVHAFPLRNSASPSKH